MSRPERLSDGPGPPSDDTQWARLAVAAALGVPGVAAISPGLGEEVATYGPETRVLGVRVTRHLDGIDLTLHLVAELAHPDDDGLDLFKLAETVREKVAESFARAPGGRACRIGAFHVTFDDFKTLDTGSS